jgi:phage tail-like protein
MPPTTTPFDIAGVALELDAVQLARFGELVGITSEVETVELSEGSEPDQPHRLPGRAHPPTIVLRRAFTADTALSTWHDAVRDGDAAARRHGALVLYGSTGEPVARYHLEHAWPSKLDVAATPTDPGHLTETVTLTCDALHRVPV